MPIFVYVCTRCGREVEEIQKFTDPPPISDEPCPEAEVISGAGSATQDPCNLERVPTTFLQRWDGSYNNDGRGGWVRQGDAMVKMTQGKNTTRYGDGSV